MSEKKKEQSIIIENFQTEGGDCIPQLRLHYTSYGTLNAAKDNVVWCIHPLTANSDPQRWWPGIVGKGHVFNAKQYYIICVNNPGSPYGSFNPLDINPDTGTPYYHAFPRLTVRDLVRAFDELRLRLGIEKIRIANGASMGGQILFQWLASFPEAIRSAIIVAASPSSSAWMLAWHHLQKQCIHTDPTWQEETEDAGREGLKQARQMALLSYRSPIIFQLFQNVKMHLSNEADEAGFEESKRYREEKEIEKIVSEYLDYQGVKFVDRFNVFSYLVLLEMMNSHSIEGDHGSVEAALQTIKADILMIGIDSDLLFNVKELKSTLPFLDKVQYREISSVYGHDAFLVEYKQIEDIIVDYLHQIDEYYLP